MALDATGGVLLAGTFDGILNLGGSDLTAPGPSELFAAKLDNNGTHVWSGHHGGPVSRVRLGVDKLGSMHISGTFTGMMQTGFTTLDSGKGEVFLMSIASTSAIMWVYNYKATLIFDTGVGASTSLAGETMLTLGSYGTVNFGGADLAPQDYSLFVAKLDIKGKHVWSKVFAEGYPVTANNIVMAPSGESVLVGADGNFHAGTLAVPAAPGYVAKLGR